MECMCIIHVCAYVFQATGGSGVAGMRSMMQSLPELWAEDQYSNEYDLSSFMKSLSHTRI